MNIKYFDFIKKFALETPDKKCVYDDQGDLTYRQMDEQSACIYSWLKAQDIGTEDFVMIYMPRDARTISAIQGVWKAGAAFVVCGTDFPQDRYEFVYEDCGCRIEINEENWQEIMQRDPLEGREAVGLHDAAYAIYTSGTQGVPKGVLHEYGNIDENWRAERCEGVPFCEKDDIYGLIAPLSYEAAVMAVIHTMANNGAMYIAPSSIVRNPDVLKSSFEDVGVTVAYLPPSMLRVLKSFNSQFRKLVLSSEISSNIFFEDLIMINAHAMTESGYITAAFKMDRAYEKTPIGKSQWEKPVYVIDGELCFENQYFRGYINLPELTASCFKDGLFHSGDMVEVLPDGNMVIIGRKDAMIKICGNRVEPAEVENVLKRVLGIKNVIVKGFIENYRAFLCAYYTDDVEIDPAEVREKLKEVVPKFMIPSCYVRLDKFPLLTNGKLDRRALTKPDINAFKNEYVAPRNPEEEEVCDIFGDMLNLPEIGIDDDFFELGGDSIGAIGVATLLGWDGITAAGIYEYRTPRVIALKKQGDQIPAAFASQIDSVPPEEYVRYIADYQLAHPQSTLFNVYRLYRMDRSVDAERLIKAFNAVCEAHPMLHSVIVKNDDGYMIEHRPELAQDIIVEDMCEKEFEGVKGKLVYPFEIGKCVYHARLIRTECYTYFFADFHHTAIDGFSTKVFRRELGRAYTGEKLERDKFYECRLELDAQRYSKKYEDDRAYVKTKFDGQQWDMYPTPDRNDDGYYQSLERKLGNDADMSNASTMAAVLYAIAKYNGSERVMCTCTYHCRDSQDKSNCLGVFIRDVPVGIVVRLKADNDDSTIDNDAAGNDSADNANGKVPYIEDKAALLSRVKCELQDGIRHLTYQWALDTDKYVVYTTNQGKIREFEGIAGISCESIDVPCSHVYEADNAIDMEFMNDDDGKRFTLKYNDGMYDRSSAERFADLIASWFDPVLGSETAGTNDKHLV